ncbi:hypothetical protein GJ744_011786 [Endocarpon pusillum]|uniref:Uncharacterized protein n=1 Tax=Endocarpon pusillum TaxID=364733 RepID=A0A8H7AEP1_9EURO|nr:hypothetical protein GJ744_011786 [Endocarpon pusillum]
MLDHPSKSLRVIIQGSAKTMQNFDTLQQAFATEKNKAPLMDWFKNTPRRPHLQKGSNLKKEERPHYVLSRTVTFFNWTEYLVIQGYGMIQEQELIQQGYEDLKEGQVDVIFIDMPFPTHQGQNKRLLRRMMRTRRRSK